MKILIVEDESAIANQIRMIFKKLNMQSDNAVSGDEALDFLDIYQYDIILLDVMLPDMTGFDLLKNIRANKIQTPVLILSGLGEAQNKIDGLTLGADDYITKPFNKDELVARVNAIVRRSKGHAESNIHIGDLEINLDSKQVSLMNKNLHLTNKEYSILEILSLKRGKPVSKEHLLDQLYGGQEEPEPKIIDVFVCKLRKKIGKIEGKDYIGTIWGQGYVLDSPQKD